LKKTTEETAMLRLGIQAAYHTHGTAFTLAGSR